MKISAKNLKKCIDNLEAVEAKLQAMPLHHASNIVELTEIYGEKHKVGITENISGRVLLNFESRKCELYLVFTDIARY